jgi:L,D-transpeptidase ErfK/SrfK
VTIVNQPVKLGWSGGQLYLEIHPEQFEAEALESTGAPPSRIGTDADDVVLKAAGTEADRLDWYAIHMAETLRNGVPVRVTR